ncbi:MAG: hypothetical protein F6K06_19470 [Okeania sp. SIO1H4]|uniref:hypothetical protein n=2 Tax=Microcoleaceae TaxID=1892252 RepID=UPI0012927BF0|nr:hypothetical protein [Okeania sp. SIO1H5]NES77840.1 hypothetical protein [Okeania sp. SIO1H4]NES91001.1 hypothetical protein [Okeania sp. SIO2B9]
MKNTQYNVMPALADMRPLSPDVFIRGRELDTTTVYGLQECSNLCESNSECIGLDVHQLVRSYLLTFQ